MSNKTPPTPPATMPPEQGLFSSKGMMDFGIQVGQYMFHRGPTEIFLDHIPDKLSGPIRGIVAKGFREVGKRTLKSETDLQEAMNNKLFMETTDPKSGYPILAEASEEYVKELFPKGKQDEWPTQLVICTKDVRPDPAMLRQTMNFFPQIAGDILEKPLDVVQGFDESAKDRVVILGVFNTDKDILHNAASVLERAQEIIKHPDSVKGMSEAAVKAGDTLLSAMTLHQDSGTTVLRDDSPDILRHVMMHGYSQGGNIATDTFRHIRAELMSGKYELAQDAKGKETISTANSKLVGDLLGNAYIYTIAAADPSYHPQDLTTLPPRDNTRSDGDLVISGAVGTNKKQANYQSKWSQDEAFVARNDRLIETIGPRKKLFGLREPRGQGYHAMLGHGDDEYRYSVVDQAGGLLKERFLPRLKGQAVASDITFSNDRITMDFERGTPPKKMRDTSDAIAKDLQKQGINVESGIHPDTPYQLVMRAEGSLKTLNTLRDTLRNHDVYQGENVNIALNADVAANWLKNRLEKLPDTNVSVETDEHGPMLRINASGPDGDAGPQLRNLLMRGLDRVGIKAERSESPSVNLPLEDVVQAFKQYKHRGMVEEISR